MPEQVEILTDTELAERVDARLAVDTCRAAILAAYRGELITPPRVHAELGDGRITYTAGRFKDEWFGYRSYDTIAPAGGDQLVTVHRSDTGKAAAIALGHELGRMRTGAIGGVAADALAGPSAARLGIIGTGPQAWMQLWAIQSVRGLVDVKVYGRDRERRERFAANACRRYGFTVRAVDTPEAAVADVDMAVLATNSATPVVDTEAIDASTFVTTLGPKQHGRAEFDGSLAQRSAQIVTDSLSQLNDYDPPFVLRDTQYQDLIIPLGAVLAGEVAPRAGALFCSVGLAGTETYLLARLAGL